MKNVWEPIETAPKDGTPILLATDLVPDGMVIGEWNENWSCAEFDGFAPTHWMPLPNLPE